MHCPFNFIQWSITWQLDGAGRFYNCFVAISSAGLKYHRRGPGKTSWENIRSYPHNLITTVASLLSLSNTVPGTTRSAIGAHNPAPPSHWSTQPSSGCDWLSSPGLFTAARCWVQSGRVWRGEWVWSLWSELPGHCDTWRPAPSSGTSTSPTVTKVSYRSESWKMRQAKTLCVSGGCVCSWRGLLCDAGAWVGWMGWHFYKACKNILDIVFDVWIRRGWRINKTVALCSVVCIRD